MNDDKRNYFLNINENKSNQNISKLYGVNFKKEKNENQRFNPIAKNVNKYDNKEIKRNDKFLSSLSEKQTKIESLTVNLDEENKFLRHKIIEKEKDLIKKDSIITDLKNRLEKLEFENVKLKSKENLENSLIDKRANKMNSKMKEIKRRTNSLKPKENISKFNINPVSTIINKTSQNNTHLDKKLTNLTKNSLDFNENSLFPFFNHEIQNEIIFPELIKNSNIFNNFHEEFIPDYFPEYIDPVKEVEEAILNEICPNPDQMTYEQLLEFQDKVGFVEKGFTKKEVERIPFFKFSKLRSNNNIDSKCTVCQYDFTENDFIRKLSCRHIYHKDCVDEWLLKDKKCPVCKKENKIF